MSGVIPARSRPAPAPPLSEIQGPVRAELERTSDELRRIVLAHFPIIEQVSEHLLLMKGKLFRPTLCLLSSAVEGEPSIRAATLGAIVELVHVATLVHDDSVDHSALRRGMPTVNSLFSHQVSVIMGDFLYSRAIVELVRDGDLEVLRVLADATNAMTVGEMRQLTAVDTLQFSEGDYEALIRAKTASLIAASCEIGAIAGSPAHRAALARYGDRLGMAFQVVDDLLDYTADVAVTGKPTGLDLREHKVTLPLIAALRTMSPAARGDVERLFATPEPDDEQIGTVVDIVTELGGLEYARRRGDQYAAEAEEALDAVPESAATAALRDAVAYVMERTQ
ncbi:MAG TPA: polyprenyl synthetase family protein [Gemmatimonadaceae bacterium]|nr:polyprenyl synthetase family protein [Gemmatimonadaceae bacterium]